MKFLLVLSAMAGLMLAHGPADAQSSRPARADQVRIVINEPINPRHQRIRDMMRQRGVLDAVTALLNPFRLPRPLTVEVRGCDGREGAYYTNDSAVLCYEYVELIERHAPKVATPWGGVARSDAIVGGTLDTILHEVGHALFEMLEIPVFGREEDAADFFSIYLLSQFPFDSAQRLIQGVAYMMGSEAREDAEDKIDPRAFAGAHAFNAQRYYNVLCLAYGANPALVGNVPPPGLSAWRTKSCGDEYAMLKRVFTRLIQPHVDESKQRGALRQVNFGWSPLVTAAEAVDKPPLADGALTATERRDGAVGAAARP